MNFILKKYIGMVEFVLIYLFLKQAGQYKRKELPNFCVGQLLLFDIC